MSNHVLNVDEINGSHSLLTYAVYFEQSWIQCKNLLIRRLEKFYSSSQFDFSSGLYSGEGALVRLSRIIRCVCKDYIVHCWETGLIIFSVEESVNIICFFNLSMGKVFNLLDARQNCTHFGFHKILSLHGFKLSCFCRFLNSLIEHSYLFININQTWYLLPPVKIVRRDADYHLLILLLRLFSYCAYSDVCHF